MRYSQYRLKLRPGNPLVNALVIVLGALAIAASLVLGFFAFVVLGTVFIMFAAIVGIRLWWLNWRFGRRQTGDTSKPGAVSAELIEGEYRILRSEQRETLHPGRSQNT